MRSKRGISPLIATVLLIAFAVALGAVVMNWGKEKIETKINKTETTIIDAEARLCDKVQLDIETINKIPKICISQKKASSIEFLATNNGEKDIEKLKLTLLGSAGDPLNTEIPDSKIVAGETRRFSYIYPAELGDLQKARIVPLVRGIDRDKVCSAAYTESSEIKPC